MNIKKSSLQKFFVYIFGIAIFTLGIALTIQSKLGTSPFDALLVGLFRTFGLTIGSWEIIVGGIMVLINAALQRKRPEYLAMLTALITGVFIDFWVFMLSGWIEPEAILLQYTCLIIGMLLVGFGVAFYLITDIAIIPFDRSMLVVSKLTGWNISISRAMIGVLLVIIAYFFDGSIGIGTLLIALFSGVFIHSFLPLLKRMIKFSP